MSLLSLSRVEGSDTTKYLCRPKKATIWSVDPDAVTQTQKADLHRGGTNSNEGAQGDEEDGDGGNNEIRSDGNGGSDDIGNENKEMKVGVELLERVG